MAVSRFIRWLRRAPASSTLRTFLVISPIAVVVIIVVFSVHTAVVERVSSQARTLLGHNLDPTPWHLFPRPPLPHLAPSTILRCSYLSCSLSSSPAPRRPPKKLKRRPKQLRSCPYFFRNIHSDLYPWKRSLITQPLLQRARTHASMRILIIGGRKLYVDLYYACVQSRAMFTVWGILQLLRRYPGMVPDVDMMFDCMDRPSVNRTEYHRGGGNVDGFPLAPPVFRYCTTKDHLDIPFPDWSFWGWSEINIKPWDEEFKSIKLGSQAKTWMKKDATAYWKGNPDVGSPIRMALLSCNDSKMWGAQIMQQNWLEEANSGFTGSELSNQCNHRYKIYAEGFAWSVSLKYILACGSLSLLIDPYYQDFFSRGLLPKVHYYPISPIDVCQSIKSTVDWGNENPSEAEAIGKKAQAFMEELDMDHVYDYMYHLILEYSRLLDFKPTPPPTAQEVCLESILCLADKKQKKFLESSYTSLASFVPCSLSQL